MAVRARLLPALFTVLAVSTASLAGCGRYREPLYASTVVVGDAVLVRVKHAYVKGDKVVVKTFMQNRTDQAVSIDRDAIGLRLEDGSVIPRASGRTTRHEPYLLSPGEGRDVNVDFRLGGRAADIGQAFLVIDGVEVGREGPRMLGEVALSSRHAIRRNVAALSAAEAAAAEDAEAAEPADAEAGDQGQDAEPLAADGTEGAAEEPEPAAEEGPAEEPAEGWEIGP